VLQQDVCRRVKRTVDALRGTGHLEEVPTGTHTPFNQRSQSGLAAGLSGITATGLEYCTGPWT
jgi:hypothetical protein